MSDDSLTIRPPESKDGAGLWELVKQCPPLDVNSPYLYLLLCDQFADTCLVIDDGQGLKGFVTAFISPKQKDSLFVWQIAVHSSLRGKGMGKKLIKALWEQVQPQGVRFLECTVSPSNQASRGLFYNFAKELNVQIEEKTLFDREMFPQSQNHEQEVLIKIGPV